MKRILLFVIVLLQALLAFVGCHKDPIEFGNVGVLNINLQRGYKTMNKGAVESFDARVTIYYSEKDTISYNSRFVDTDGDGRYTNDPSVLDNIYVRREVGFWVGVQAVIQGDTVTGMSDPTNLLYLSDENPVLDVNIVLVAGYPRIVLSTSTQVVGEDVLIFGEVLEGGEQLEDFAFAIRRGPLGDEEKHIWSKRFLSESDMEELFSYADYEFYEAEIFDNDAKRFGCALEMMDFDSVEYSVAAIALMRMNDGDSIQTAIHSPVVSMKISGGGAIIEDYVYIDEPYYNGDTVTLYGYYVGNKELNGCGFVLGFSEYELTDTMQCRLDGASFSLPLYGFQPNTTYYYKAYVKTADGTIVSEETGQFQIMGMIQEFGVYTQSATDITESSATLNGYVTYTDGVEYCGFILDMGTYNDTLMVQPTADGYFSYQASNLTPSTTYSYQAFANRSGWVFGEEVSFTTAISEQQETSYSQPTGYRDGYGYVDLGLPSGLLWAYNNVGANTPTDYGDYYAWGETEPHYSVNGTDTTWLNGYEDGYSWTTYRYCNGSESTLTKYCNDSEYGDNGFTDTLTTLESIDDAATANWGAGWRMPTQEELQELYDNCTQEWTEQNGVRGYLFTGPNGNSIFLPAAGYRYDSSLIDAGGSGGCCWSSSLGSDISSLAWYLYFNSGICDFNYYNRYYGRSVRAVCQSQKKSVLPPKRAK